MLLPEGLHILRARLKVEPRIQVPETPARHRRFDDGLVVDSPIAQTKDCQERLGHTSAKPSATAIPTETSTKRCEATIHAGRWWAINKMMVSVIAAKR